MARLLPLARFVVTETLSTLLAAGGCALGIAGMLFAVLHVVVLFSRPFHGIPDEIGIGLVLLIGGVLLYRFGRRVGRRPDGRLYGGDVISAE